MSVRTTDRGFTVYAEFTDTNGAHCRLQQSSAAGSKRVWFFVEGDAAGGCDYKNDGSAHLDLDLAKLLRTGLDEYIRAAEKVGKVR